MTVHAYWTFTDDHIRTACGIVWHRGESPIRVSTQQDVTCEECAKTLRAAGVAVTVNQQEGQCGWRLDTDSC